MRRAAEPKRAHEPFNGIVPWRERPHLRLQVAAEISGVSPATIYRLAGQGRFNLKRLAGRVVVDTGELIAFVDSAEPWTPSAQGAIARAKRAEAAKAAWQD